MISYFRGGAELHYFRKNKEKTVTFQKFFVACRKHAPVTRFHISHQNLNISKSRCP